MNLRPFEKPKSDKTKFTGQNPPKPKKVSVLQKDKSNEDLRKNNQQNDINKILSLNALDIFAGKKCQIEAFNVLNKKLETLNIKFIEKMIGVNNNSNQIYLNRLINLLSNEFELVKKKESCKSNNHYFYEICLVIPGKTNDDNIYICPYVTIKNDIIYVDLEQTIRQIKNLIPEKVAKLQTEIIEEITTNTIRNFYNSACSAFVGC